MTQEQREHIAATIGMLDVAAAMLKMQQMGAVGAALDAQCEILQELLDNDRTIPDAAAGYELRGDHR